MKGLKVIILLAALILPTLFYLFLKYFGKNEYRVEPLYQTGDIIVPADCHEKLTAPYLLPDSVFHSLSSTSGVDRPHLILVSMFHDESILNQTCGRELERVLDKFKADSVGHTTLFSTEHPEHYRQWFNCVFLAQEPNDVILVDDQRRLRGYYNCNDREDMDRLVDEIAIILKKY